MPKQTRYPDAASLANQLPLFVAPGWAKGFVHRGNLDLLRRPIVHNPDGTISTVRSISIGTDHGAVLIPTVIGNRVVSNEQAVEHYRRTGQHLGVFANEHLANLYAVLLHHWQAQFYR